MISDMERIGDQAEDIVDVAWFIKNVDADSKVIIKEMAKTAVTMVTNSVESYVKKSLDITEDVVATDDKMDELFSNAKKQVIYAIKSNSDDAETLVDLLMVAKYFERIGDHAENIVEWVQYAITGEHKSKR